MTRSALLLMLVVCLVALAAGDSRDLTITSLHNQIYTTLTAYPCVRLLNNNGTIGCAQPYEQMSGLLQLITTSEELDTFANSGSPKGRDTFAVLEPDLFTAANLNKLRDHKADGDLTGVLVLWGVPSASSSFFSQDVATKWNPNGDGMSRENYNFPVWLVSASQTADIREKARANGNGKLPLWGVASNGKMQAGRDSETCLRRSMCMPMGGQSVWSAPWGLNSSRQALLVTATLDSTSMFHDMAPGADAYLSGVVVLAAAQEALTRTLQAEHIKKDVVFAYFGAEAWKRLGSRMFAKDIDSFVCNSQSSTDSCSSPYKSSLAFQGLKLSNVEGVLDVSQVGLLDSSKTVHGFLGSATKSSKLWKNVLDAINFSPDLSLTPATMNYDPTHDLPPSPAQSFVELNTSIPVVVLADHAWTFNNKLYRSHMDRHDQQPINTTNLCEMATLLARSISNAVAWDSSVSNHTVADCSFVTQLWECLTVNYKCPLVESVLGTVRSSGTVELSQYTSVFGSSPSSINLQAATYFLRELLYMHGTVNKNTSVACLYDSDCLGGRVCAGYSNNTACVERTVHFHDARPRGIRWKDGNDWVASQWVIDKSSGDDDAWTESNWKSLYLQLFQADHSSSEVGVLIGGLVEFVVAFAVTAVVKLIVISRFKLND